MAETLGKIISQAAFLSRRAAVTAIKSGRVRINGKVCMNPAERIEPGMRLAFDRRPLEIPDLTEKWYVMLNKPVGYVCTASDPHAPLKAIDLIVPAPPVRLFSAGRLDKESSGKCSISSISISTEFKARGWHIGIKSLVRLAPITAAITAVCKTGPFLPVFSLIAV